MINGHVNVANVPGLPLKGSLTEIQCSKEIRGFRFKRPRFTEVSIRKDALAPHTDDPFMLINTDEPFTNKHSSGRIGSY